MIAPVLTALLEAASDSLGQLRKRITGVRHVRIDGGREIIGFYFDGIWREAVNPRPNTILIPDEPTNAESAKRLAAIIILDDLAKPS